MKSLHDLIVDKIAAIHIRGFYSLLAAEHISQNILNLAKDEIDYGQYGEVWSKHAQSLIEYEQWMTKLCLPFIHPLIQLRSSIGWPAGIAPQYGHGNPYCLGSFRLFKPSAFFTPHYDGLGPLSSAPETIGLLDLLVANIYLHSPSKGGDLQLWCRLPSETEKQTVREYEGLDYDSIEPPAITLHPDSGDLIIFKPRFLHAVTPCQDDHRITAYSFIGYFGDNIALSQWAI